ncbi:hypothetical protein FGO68_gene67 [Halteria grandinella]|uniref:Uncharacterized protein n=1 Tax=Halteria grandinella TaxID=5974 RepID=A0A8J8T7Q2_HALGN|nr:hypothetical protein FGO68_gene67 [Halteria grandinella]
MSSVTKMKQSEDEFNVADFNFKQTPLNPEVRRLDQKTVKSTNGEAFLFKKGNHSFKAKTTTSDYMDNSSPKEKRTQFDDIDGIDSDDSDKSEERGKKKKKGKGVYDYYEFQYEKKEKLKARAGQKTAPPQRGRGKKKVIPPEDRVPTGKQNDFRKHAQGYDKRFDFMNYGEDDGEDDNFEDEDRVDAPLGRSGASLCGLKRRIPSEGELSMEGAADTDDEEEGDENGRGDHFSESSGEEQPTKIPVPKSRGKKKGMPPPNKRISKSSVGKGKKNKAELAEKIVKMTNYDSCSNPSSGGAIGSQELSGSDQESIPAPKITVKKIQSVSASDKSGSENSSSSSSDNEENNSSSSESDQKPNSSDDEYLKKSNRNSISSFEELASFAEYSPLPAQTKSKKLSKKEKKQEKKRLKKEAKKKQTQKKDSVKRAYKKCIQKAQRYLSYSQDSTQVNKEFIKNYINKAMDYYKTALKYHCRTDKDKARIYILMADCHIEITPKQYEHDTKGKHLARACDCMKCAIDLCGNDFQYKIYNDQQEKIVQLITKNLIQRARDGQLLCTLMEIIYQNVHKKLKRLRQFIGRELYHIYYKLSCDIVECKGDLDNACRYLKSCRSISKELGMKDSQVIDMKLAEIQKIKNRKVEEKQIQQARECIKVGDMYIVQGSGRLKDALSQYQQALKLSEDKITEIEAISHFKIGRTLLQMLNKGGNVDKQKYFLAKNHLIDFQIQCHDIPEKSINLQKKQKEARQLLQHINDILKPQGSSNSANPGLSSNLGDLSFKDKKSQSKKYDIPVLLKDLVEGESKTVFELFDYLKQKFTEKTKELDQIYAIDRYKVERSKIRKTILKFISVFHPDKQCFESKEFGPLAEEITKQLNFHLKSY